MESNRAVKAFKLKASFSSRVFVRFSCNIYLIVNFYSFLFNHPLNVMI